MINQIKEKPNVWVKGFRILKSSWIMFLVHEYVFSDLHVVGDLWLLSCRIILMALSLLVLAWSLCNFTFLCCLFSNIYCILLRMKMCFRTLNMFCHIQGITIFSDFLSMCWNTAAPLQVRLMHCCVRQKHRNEFCMQVDSPRGLDACIIFSCLGSFSQY